MKKREKISDEVFVEDIKRLALDIGRIPRQDDYKKGGTYGLNTLLLRKPWREWLMEIFGQTNVNRERKNDKILDIDIMNDVKKVGEKLGKVPTMRDYELNGSFSLSLILRRKKWNDWLEGSVGDVNYNRSDDALTKRINDEDLISDVKRVANEINHPPTRGEYDKLGKYSSDTIVSRKPWEQFVTEIFGHSSSKIVIDRTKISDEDLIEQLKILKQQLDRIPKKEDLGGLNNYSYSAYVRAFGTFGNALVKAGLIDPLQRYNVSKQELIDELKRVYTLLGHTPSMEEFLNNSPIKSCHSIRVEFKDWTHALLAADIPVIKAKNVSQEDVKTAIIKWHTENGNDDTCLEYWKIRKAHDNRKFPYSCNTVSSKFDNISWEEIMHECGFPNYVTRDHYIYGRKRGNFTGLDGNEYLSSLEKEVGDYLFELKNSDKISKYEYEALVCDGKQWTCDFKVFLNNDDVVWLEADGLRKNRYKPYTSGQNEKIQYYVENKKNYGIVSYSVTNVRGTIDKILFP